MKTLQLTNLRSYVEQELFTAVMLLISAFQYRYWKSQSINDLAKSSDEDNISAMMDCLGIDKSMVASSNILAWFQYIKNNVSLKTLDVYYTTHPEAGEAGVCFSPDFVSKVAEKLSKVQTPELALAIVELMRQLILHGENLYFLNVTGATHAVEDFEWFITEINQCSKRLTTEEILALISLITQQIKLRKPELVLNADGNENAVVNYMCELASVAASKKRLPGKWGAFLRPQKEKTRHIIISKTPKFKKSLLLVPGESTRDVQTLLFNNIGTLDSHWILVERDPRIMKIIQKRSPFPEDYANVKLHRGDYSTFDTTTVPPLDFVWLDQLGNFQPQQLIRLRNLNLDMPHLDFWITFTYFPRNNPFFPELKAALLQHKASLENEIRKIRLISDLDPKFQINIIVQWIMLNYIFERFHFDTEVVLYADQMSGRTHDTPIYMVLFHLKNFTRRGRPFWATSIVRNLMP